MALFKFKFDSKIINTLRLIKNVFFAVILTIFALVLVVTMISRISGKPPSLMGYSVYRVSSGSMEPTLKVGDVILSKSVSRNSINTGDIITYMGDSGELADKIVTHRVIKKPYFESGTYYIITKGDNNPSEDSPVELSAVYGKMQGKLSVITDLYSFFITPWGLISLIILIIAAFFNEIIIFIRSIIGFKEDDEQSLDAIIERYKKEQEHKNKTGNSDFKAEQNESANSENDTEESVE